MPGRPVELAPTALLPDVPTALHHQDAFAHSAYAEVLAETLRRGKQPMTLGLIGPWGVGKSSVLLALADRLPPEECAFVLFDAWRYDDAVTLRRQLLRDVAQELEQQHALCSQFDARTRLDALDVDRQDTTFRMRLDRGGMKVAASQAAVAAAGVFGALQVHAIADSLGAQKPDRGLFLTLALSLITLAVTVTGQAFRAVPSVRVRRRIEDPDHFHALFRDMVAAVDRPRLIISIDNLDRCTPEVAVGLLSTIKTYLEPAADQAHDTEASPTEVLFVLAVDDDALRRHLAPADGTDDAEEYLRKIFTATVRFAPLHRDDLRSYVRRQLHANGDRLDMSTEEEAQLVAVIDAALRSNPRQVIQFINNFRLRLALVRARESGSNPTIRGDISREPLMIAKLALVEERWPRRYDELEQAPHRLDEWHRQAREPMAHSGLEPDFAAFLRVSDTITTTTLRPFLQLKQSEEELRLDEYEAFRAAAVSADRAGVGAVLERAGLLATDYLDRLPHIFLEELRAGSPTAARCILDVALTEPRLGPTAPSTTQMLRAAQDDPSFAGQWDSLPAASLLDAAIELDDCRSAAAVRRVLERVSASDADRASEAIDAVTSHLAVLNLDARQRLQDLTTTPPLVDRPPHLRAIAMADITLLSTVAIDHLALTLQQQPALLGGAEGDAIAATLILAVECERFASSRDSIVHTLGACADAVVAQPAATRRAARIAQALADTGHDVGRALEAWLERAKNVPPARRMEIAGTTWPVATGGGRALRLPALVEALLAGGEDGLVFVASVAPNLNDQQRQEMGHVLTDSLASAQFQAPPDVAYATLEILVGDEARSRMLAVGLAWADRAVAPEQLRDLLVAVDMPAADSRSRELLCLGAAESFCGEPLRALPWLAAATRADPLPPEIAQRALPLLDSAIRAMQAGFVNEPALALARQVAVSLGPGARSRGDEVLEAALQATWNLSEKEAEPVLRHLAAAEAALQDSLRIDLRAALLERWAAADDSARQNWEPHISRLQRFESEDEVNAFTERTLAIAGGCPDPEDRGRLLGVVQRTVGLHSQDIAEHVAVLRQRGTYEDLATIKAMERG